MQVDVSIIIVCMNRPDLLYPCLESIEAHTVCSHEIIVTAYRFSPENLASLKKDWPLVRVVVNDSLAGFAENNNLALKEAKGEFCFIVNDDTLMSMPVIDSLLADFNRVPERTAAISPKIVFPDGRIQTCGRDPWTPWRYIRHYLHLTHESKPGAWSGKEGLFRSWTLNGACFMIRATAFRDVGFFDETYTFTPEDIALGQLLNERGWEVWADADVAITHLAGATSGPIQMAIKPVKVKGCLIYYSSLRNLKNPQGSDSVNSLTYGMMACVIWCFEALRVLRWLPFIRKGPASRPAIMFHTARNVMKSLWNGMSPKELFVKLFEEIQR